MQVYEDIPLLAQKLIYTYLYKRRKKKYTCIFDQTRDVIAYRFFKFSVNFSQLQKKHFRSTAINSAYIHSINCNQLNIHTFS